MEHILSAEELKAIELAAARIKESAEGYLKRIGGELTVDNMGELTADEHAILAYHIIRDEAMEGGFIQLIQNGWGPYIFDNPFPYIYKQWGLKDLSKLLYAARKEYHIHREELERDCSDEDFMAKYELHEKLNDLGDLFLDEIQEVSTPVVAEHIS